MKQNKNLITKNSQSMLHALAMYMLPLLMTLALAGCKPEPTPVATTNPAGNYTLVTVDGNKVPCEVKHDGHTLTIKSGTFIINADGSCSSKMAFTPPSGSDATREVRATYTQEASKLTMKWEGAGVTIGTIEGDTFTMNNEGMVLAYKK